MHSPTVMRVEEAAAGSDENGKNNPIPFRRHRRCVSYGGERRGVVEYFGWIYHLGVNSIGHDYCHLRFLFIRGKYVEMYKRDPHENPEIKPIRRGVIGPTLVVEELGPRKFNNGELFVIRFYSRLDESKRGEIGCASAEEAQRWMETFDQAKQQSEYEILRGGCRRSSLAVEADINLDGHRPRVRRYAQGLKKLIRIGQGPEVLARQCSNLSGQETLLRQNSNLANYVISDGFFEGNFGDVIEGHEWKCVRTINGVRILEDVADLKNRRGALVKAVAVVDATADTVLELILDLDKHKRYEWDTLTSDLELVDSYEGNYDVVYGTYDPKYLTRWQSKRDFVFSRQWFRGQDGTYTILQLPATHKKQPPKSGYNRTKINPSTWEIRHLNMPVGFNNTKCLVTQMLEINSAGWGGWKKNNSSKFEKSIPYALLSQVAGLKEYIEANPALKCGSSTIASQTKFFDFSASNNDVYEDEEVNDEFFYDAISADSSSSSEHEQEDLDNDKKELNSELNHDSSKTINFGDKQSSGSCAEKELDQTIDPTDIDPTQFSFSLPAEKDDANSNSWSSPSGSGFMIRGKSYLKDNGKVIGGDPLLQLIAVDWFKVDKATNKIAQHAKCLVQSEAGKKLPFILVMNLQVPAKPNYSLVLYYAASRPVNKNSLLGKFVDGTDAFRDSRFKLIPSIIEGYWMVKRAVGTKACLLGKAVSCKYFREDNFLEIDVDIGSSSVARSVIGLVLGYVTSLVVDLAILIEAKEEEELPEYILGTARLNRVRLDAAVTLEI